MINESTDKNIIDLKIEIDYFYFGSQMETIAYFRSKNDSKNPILTIFVKTRYGKLQHYNV